MARLAHAGTFGKWGSWPSRQSLARASRRAASSSFVALSQSMRAVTPEVAQNSIVPKDRRASVRARCHRPLLRQLAAHEKPDRVDRLESLIRD